jgi:HlyD family secretion protein
MSMPSIDLKFAMKTAPKEQKTIAQANLKKPNYYYRKAKSWLLWSGFLGIMVVAGWIVYEKYIYKPPQPVAVRVLPVKTSTVETTVTESGTVELGRQITLKSPKDVTVEKVKVKEGDRIAAKQSLIILRDRARVESYQDQIVANAKTQLDLDRARERIAEAKKTLQARETRYQEAQNLLNKGFISQTEAQEDLANLNQARSALEDTLVEEQKAQLDVDNGSRKLAALEKQLKDRLVTSPIEAIVLKINVRNGDGIKTEGNLITLGDPSQEIIKLQLTTLNALKVSINQVARVSIIGPNSQVFTGRVISLSPQASVPIEDSNSSESTYDTSSGGQAKVEAKVLLDKPSNTLIPGSLVSVQIVTESQTKAIAVPSEAIQRNKGIPFVWLKDANDRAKKQPVTVGLQGLQQVAITSGLKPGDSLLIPEPGSSLSEDRELKIKP